MRALDLRSSKCLLPVAALFAIIYYASYGSFATVPSAGHRTHPAWDQADRRVLLARQWLQAHRAVLGRSQPTHRPLSALARFAVVGRLCPLGRLGASSPCRLCVRASCSSPCEYLRVRKHRRTVENGASEGCMRPALPARASGCIAVLRGMYACPAPSRC